MGSDNTVQRISSQSWGHIHTSVMLSTETGDTSWYLGFLYCKKSWNAAQRLFRHKGAFWTQLPWQQQFSSYLKSYFHDLKFKSDSTMAWQMVPRSSPSKLIIFFQPQVNTVFKYLFLFTVRILDLVFDHYFCSSKVLALAHNWKGDWIVATIVW